MAASRPAIRLSTIWAGNTTPRPRIVGIDVARGLAIMGMFVAHAIPRPTDAELLVDGRSSILFATLAGVSLGLMSGGASPFARGHRADAVRSTLIRALALLLLGWFLWLTGSEIAIILDYYAVMFALLVPVLFAPRWVLAALAVVLAIGAPLVAEQFAPFDPVTASISSIVGEYLFTGYYPAVVWLPFLCVGLICARSDVAKRSTQYAMIGAGTATSALGYGAALVLPGIEATAHSNSTAEVLGSGGLAIAIIGTLVLLASAPGPVGRVTSLITWPVAAAGGMALSVYTAHIFILATTAYARDTSGTIDYPGWPLLITLIASALLGASLWRRFLGQGPLEQALSTISRRRRRRHPTPTSVPRE